MSINATAIRYLRWLAILAGALIITAISMITTVDPVSAPPAPTDTELTLGGIKTVEQTFTITEPDLVGLAIRLSPTAQSGADTKIPVHLRYADGPPFDLVIGDAVVRAARDNILTLRFPPITVIRDPRAPTETLRLTLEIPRLSAGTGPRITARESPLGQGGIVIDGRADPRRDLVIIPIYQRRWADRIWPISAMARGKPGLLSWPPLYPLLAYMYLITLGAGVTNIRRTFLPRDG